MRHFIFKTKLKQQGSRKTFSSFWKRIHVLSTKNNKAFSLLEMLVALTLFAFLFLYVTQLVRQNYRYVRKIKEDLKFTNFYLSYQQSDQTRSGFCDLFFRCKL